MGWTACYGYLLPVFILILIYHRASLVVFALSVAILLGFGLHFSHAGILKTVICFAVFVAVFLPFAVTALRARLLTKPILHFYRRAMPHMSRTEKEALAAGTTGFEAEIFCGNPNWQAFLARPAALLSEEEKAFIAGPVDTLCSMINDWDITHCRADIPPEMWKFIADHGFYGLIVPKEYGGYGFSACAQSEIHTKIYGVSPTVATTVSVPNSLGPGELLLHYGTEEQKQYYLPRLAQGREIPCFALTSEEAGSDAGAMPDTGVVCRGIYGGKEVLGIRLNFSKRYITLAPVATVIGLAFRLLDPDHLLGNKKKPGITCALIPRTLEGLIIGRRHFPTGVAFQNGPVSGKDLFIPVDWIIGGPAMAGQGWKMLMECLAAGRAISLPASGMGGARMMASVTGAYARVRRQFGVPISHFEGIQEALARIAGFTCIMDGTRLLTAASIDQGARPAVASAITKCYVTEMGRKVGNDAMDIHGGKGVCLGPQNWLGRSWQSIPVAITVEGANILTRNLIIFGQGAMRCHPYIFAEFEAATLSGTQGLLAFDRALWGHAGYTLSNIVRGLLLALTGGRIARTPAGASRRARKYYRQITRMSAAFALVSDVALLQLRGSLKRREFLSARLSDMLAYLYMLSGVLKQHHDIGYPPEDAPLVAWAAKTCLYETQQALDGFLRNYPDRITRVLLRCLVLPFGRRFSPPSDRLSAKIAKLVSSDSATRDRLMGRVFVGTVSAGNPVALLNDALQKVIRAEVPLKFLHQAAKQGQIAGETHEAQAKDANEKGLLSDADFQAILEAAAARQRIIAVDDFAGEELAHGNRANRAG